jgi:indolepyruvate ferredoxin oxidoreductase
MPAKREYGAWMLGVMRTLAKLKWVRGGVLDLFGMTDERRRERYIRDEYIALMRRIAAQLTLDNHAVAVELAEIPERIRGFGHVKLQHIERAEEAQAALLKQFAGVKGALDTNTAQTHSATA